MYLSKITLNNSRAALNWFSNPYRVHQRLAMACEQDARILFRLEQNDNGMIILVQSHTCPNWEKAFGDLHMLAQPVEWKPFELKLEPGCRLRFRLTANPTVKRDGRRLGILDEEKQVEWLSRKLKAGGAQLAACRIIENAFQRSRKSGEDEAQVHWKVTYEGLLEVVDPGLFAGLLANGIGPAKGFGFGLLSLAKAD